MFAGCGSQAETDHDGTEETGTGGQSPTADPEVIAFRDQLVPALCHAMVDCPSGTLLDHFDDFATCETRLLAEIESARAWLLPNVQVDTALAQTCIGVLSRADCPDIVEITEALRGPCADTLRGVAGLGDSCVNGRACRAGFQCDLSATCPGQCVAIPVAGEPCQKDECQAGLVCFEGTCTAPTPEGSTCGSSLPGCGEWQLCSDWGTGETACHAVDEGIHSRGEGEVCTVAPQCSPGLYCSGGDEGTCIPTIADGQPCEGPILSCADGSYCAGSSLGVGGICSPKIPLGGACSSGGPLSCAEGYCRENVCTLPVALGGACDQDSACMSDYCSEGRCALAPLCP